MGAILRLIAMGVPMAKIIAKYGKKAYKAAEAHAFKLSAASLASYVGLSKLDKKLTDKKKKEKKKERTETRKAQRGIKTYAKGSIVRKPKY